ncbi:MAG: hypothetical protein IKC10_00395 [Alphaproteobacteria bacterium]|nr:hypothetical protein [Alphaproteobacteria bacterium]
MTKIINKADKLTFKALQTALEKQELQLALISSKINIPSSPVYNPWEVLLPTLIPSLIGLVLIGFIGIMFGLLFMIAGIMLSSNIVKKKMEQRLYERTKAYLISDYNACNELWNFGGIVLINSADKKLCSIAPEGNWKEFIVLNYSQYMTDKKDEESVKTEEIIFNQEEIKEDEKAA